MPHYSSPKYLNTHFQLPLSIDDAITVFDDQFHGWFLDIGKKLVNDVAADFVTLMIVAAYFEAIEMFFKGEDSNKRSKEFFIDGFRRVFAVPRPEPPPPHVPVDVVAKQLYDQMRCGLFHAGMTRHQIQVTRNMPENQMLGLQTMDDGINYYVLNVPVLLTAVIYHFRDYLSELRNPANEDLRANFRVAWNLRCRRSDGKDGELAIPNP
ncbi:MAG: hypothetical protein K8S97_14635 [Anaerolineae bacterium]|nr:hypothetical protein [Anaerolineae bacterium]